MATDQTYSDKLKIYEVAGRRSLRRYIDFPLDLYRNDPNFVFEPFRLQREFLSSKNPFFRHSSARLLLAEIDGVVVGRIAAITNTVHNKVYNDQAGFFGFFDCINDYDVARALFDEMVSQHKLSGFTKIIGPTNFTTNDSAGMLVSGFGSPPVVMMPYNKSYYNDFLARYGFRKETDLSSYFIDDTVLTSPKFEKLAGFLSSRLGTFGISFRSIDFGNYDKELRMACSIYNESNKDNWGFIPLTEREFLHTGHQFRQFVPANLMIIALRENNIIGFVVALPDLNQAFSHIPDGRFLPFGFIKYLRYRKQITGSRILILGVQENFRNAGIDFMLYKKIQENLAKHGIRSGEACYVMENNQNMHSILSKLGAQRVKEYRIYSLGL